jgi:NitT/TauT family transport system substrate-binding protein
MSIGVWLAMPDKAGLHVLVDQDAYYKGAPVVNKLNVVPQKVLDTRRDEVVAVIRALTRLSRDFAADPAKWADAMAKYQPGMSRETLVGLAESFAQSWSVNGGMSPTELRYSSDWLYDTEDFKDLPRIDVTAWADFGPVEQVIAELGLDPAMDVPDP